MNLVDLRTLFTQYGLAWYREAYTEYIAWSASSIALEPSKATQYIHYLLRERCCR